jgi:hypothetical protein
LPLAIERLQREVEGAAGAPQVAAARGDDDGATAGGGQERLDLLVALGVVQH